MIFDSASIWRYLAVAFIAGIATFSFVQPSTKPGVAASILTAARFEEWDKIIELSKHFTPRQATDVPALAAVIDAHVAAGKADPQLKQFLSTTSDPYRKFADAWTAFLLHPKAGRKQFEELLKSPQEAWLGAYGLLCYAMEAENLLLINSAIQLAERYVANNSVLHEKTADARLLRMSLRHDYPDLSKSLKSGKDRYSSSARLAATIELHAWRDDFEAAQRELDAYVQRFGRDHLAAQMQTNIFGFTKSPAETLHYIDSQLESYPRYWGLLLQKAWILQTDELEVKQAQSVLDSPGYPERLAYARLLREDVRVHMKDPSSENLSANIATWTDVFGDYPFFFIIAARAFLNTEKYDRSAEFLARAETLTVDYAPSFTAKGLVALERGRVSEAIGAHNRYLSFVPRDIYARYYLAQAYLLARKYDSAQRELEKIHGSPRYMPQDMIDSLARELQSERAGGAKK